MNSKKQPKERHEYLIRDFYGKDRIGAFCHSYQLIDCGKVVYQLNNVIFEDGSEKQEPIDLFYERAEMIMEANSENNMKA